MTLDLTTLSTAARNKYIHIGEQHSSKDTIDQARFTLNAITRNVAALAAHGFAAADGERLRAAHDDLVAAGGARDTVRLERRQSRRAYRDAMRAGKTARERGRGVLTNAMHLVQESSAPGADDERRAIEVALAQTHSAGGHGVALDRQLETLSATMARPGLAAILRDRGGPETHALLETTTTALRTTGTARRTPLGTPEETERLDVLDGIIVTLCRNARRAARSAARTAGTPGLAKEFELVYLDDTARPAEGPVAPAPAPAPAPGGSPVVPPKV